MLLWACLMITLDIDYRKFFVALLVDIPELSLTRENVVIGVTRTGLGRVINGTEFLCIHREEYDKAFNPAAFLQIVAKLTEGDAIRPYFAPGGSTHVNLTEHEPRRITVTSETVKTGNVPRLMGGTSPVPPRPYMATPPTRSLPATDAMVPAHRRRK
ncbi:hypothetical protein NP233_g8446 [Leucocoprinus birnbaumii]|uniref:Uncharacterized protein n=1 Tax=Leucocoprinus birnbaumii TaxID=56174 RepID=A0AAD5YN58_9AGAR|nr:hypothetical protein NP233_g8446 [Leucocoprinus birnbaumii]